MKKNINRVYIPDEYLICGVSDLINPDLKKITEEIKRKINKSFESKFSFLFSLRSKNVWWLTTPSISKNLTGFRRVYVFSSVERVDISYCENINVTSNLCDKTFDFVWIEKRPSNLCVKPSNLCDKFRFCVTTFDSLSCSAHITHSISQAHKRIYI